MSEQRQELVDRCDRYLESLHCVLWGRAFNAHHPAGRAEAALWLADQIEGVDLDCSCLSCVPPKAAAK